MNQRGILLRRARLWLLFFMAALIAAGLTAIPLQWELDVLASCLGISADASPDTYTGLTHWIAKVRQAIHQTNAQYPFMAYGTDWLAFAHILIAILFLGPLWDPVRNRWVITFGLIACVAVVPTALVFGPIRGIPLLWQLIDCSFGVFGFIPLWFVRRHSIALERLAA